MTNPGRRGAERQGGGSRKKSGGKDDDEDDEELSRRAAGLELRSKKQKERDEERRRRTQCDFCGWFDADDWDDPESITARGRVYRRCRYTASVGKGRRCSEHYNKRNGDPSDVWELSEPTRGKGKKKGLHPDQF